MLSFAFHSSRLAGWPVWHRWLAPRARPADAFGFAMYYHCRSTRRVPGFVRKVKHTKLIDLTRSEDEIFGDFNKNAKQKLKRAVADSLRFTTDNTLEELREVYNAFAGAKGLPLVEDRVLEAYWPKLVVTKLSSDNQTLIMHSYMLDEAAKYACQIQAASMFRVLDIPDANAFFGRANRYLHYLDMLLLKERGYQTFDIGGVAVDTEDPVLKEVNAFKDSFGGELVEMSTYLSLPLWLGRKLSDWFGREKKPRD